MKIFRRIQRFVTIISQHVSDFKSDLNKHLKSEWFAQTYVPKYWRRTPEEHRVNRRRSVISPDKCDHIKGGPFRYRTHYIDYNVSMHTFSDGSVRIRCNGCGTKRYPDSPDWSEWVEMVQSSTNRPSSSEIAIRSLHGKKLEDL